jgi:NAD(P)-dependent dehydrogenase (short-subunit alcohol dehydrogenase family)
VLVDVLHGTIFLDGIVQPDPTRKVDDSVQYWDGQQRGPGRRGVARPALADGAGRLAAEAQEVLGEVDVLVNNAGGVMPVHGGIGAIADEEWQAVIAANLLSAVRLDRLLIPGKSRSLLRLNCKLFTATYGPRRHGIQLGSGRDVADQPSVQ